MMNGTMAPRPRADACRFCSDPPIGRFEMDEGCVCYPADRMQSLCLHHVVRANPLGDMKLVQDFTVDGTFTSWWNRGQPHPHSEAKPHSAPPKASEPTTWFGETSEDRKRTFGLIGMVAILWPLMLVGEVMYRLGIPCNGKTVRT